MEDWICSRRYSTVFVIYSIWDQELQEAKRQLLYCLCWFFNTGSSLLAPCAPTGNLSFNYHWIYRDICWCSRPIYKHFLLGWLQLAQNHIVFRILLYFQMILFCTSNDDVRSFFGRILRIRFVKNLKLIQTYYYLWTNNLWIILINYKTFYPTQTAFS